MVRAIRERQLAVISEHDAKLIGEASQLLRRVREIRAELHTDIARHMLDASLGAALMTPYLQKALVAPKRRRR